MDLSTVMTRLRGSLQVFDSRLALGCALALVQFTLFVEAISIVAMPLLVYHDVYVDSWNFRGGPAVGVPAVLLSGAINISLAKKLRPRLAILVCALTSLTFILVSFWARIADMTQLGSILALSSSGYMPLSTALTLLGILAAAYLGHVFYERAVQSSVRPPVHSSEAQPPSLAHLVAEHI